MIKASVIVVATLAANSAAYANCEGKDKTLFACSTAEGKQIEVCNFGQTIRYSYGRPNARPEIVVKAPLDKLTGISWQGCGRYTTNAVAIPNGKTIYQVSWSADNLQENDDLTGALEVTTNENSTYIACQSGPSIGNTDGIHFKGESCQ